MYRYFGAVAGLGGCVAGALIVCGWAGGDFSLAAVGAGLVCAAVLAAATALLAAPPRLSRPRDLLPSFSLKGLTIAAVFNLDREVLVYLRGIPATTACAALLPAGCDGDAIYLTWRCGAWPSLAKLVRQLKAWQGESAALRLVACRGRATVLMKDEQHCLRLPELAGSAQFPA
ncbi:MAG TPA: hypothetical protein VL984_09105 [Acidimicrobiales bacterium]|nr:hypothetical protein [Acidimicrobiales bacterium]